MPTTVDTEQLDTVLEIAEEATDSAAALTMPAGFEETTRAFDPTLDTLRIESLTATDTLAAFRATTLAATSTESWHDGLEPAPRANNAGSHTGLLAALAIIFIVIAYNFRHLARLVKIYTEDLVKVRHGRDNVFDERPATDFNILVLLIILFVVCGGILLSAAININIGGYDRPGPIEFVIQVTAIVAGYYLFQLLAYQTLGYTFTPTEGRREWIRGFFASQALLGIVLALPASLTIFYPHTMGWTILAGIICYFIARIFFILKGFRIFYDRISSLLYFILYLCTLEIIPLIWVYICSAYEYV